jgi:AraC-like DNA-binding protein
MKHNSLAYPRTHAPDLTIVPSQDNELRDGVGHVAQRDAKPEGARKIEQSIAYMMQHLNQPLQVAKLARTAHTSPSHFFVLFKRWAGSSPIDYFIRLRMQRACRLLAATTLSVKEIAGDLGYDDPFYFSRLFKSVHGIAPTDYRQAMEQPDQIAKHGGIPGPEKKGNLPPVQISELLEKNDEHEGILHEKHNMFSPAREIYLLQ